MGKKLGFRNNKVLLEVPLSGDIRTVKSEVKYYSKVTGCYLIVPIGMETDLGSIPQFLQGIFPKDGKAMFAYIVHDMLYKTGMYSQVVCDDVLEEAMKVLGVTWWRRKAVHNGLRVGGFIAYNKYRKGEKCVK